MKHSRVANGNVVLPVSESGQGPTLLFFNGAGTTQATWKRIIRELGGSYRLVTFDFRSHGTASRSPDISFEGFLSDAETVMDKVAGPQPIVVGWSMGADLAVWYAAAHPGRVAGLFLIDGAVPVNLVTDPDEVRRRLIYNPAVWYSPWLMYLVGMGYRLTPSEMATVTIEVNTRREQLLSAYKQLDCPVELVLATKTAREKGQVPSEKMPCGALAANNSHACTRRFLSSGWTTPTSFRSTSQRSSHDRSTPLSNAFRLARQSQWETSDHHQLTPD